MKKWIDLAVVSAAAYLAVTTAVSLVQPLLPLPLQRIMETFGV